MKKKISSLLLLTSSLLLSITYTNAQSWNLAGNTNMTNTSKIGGTSATIAQNFPLRLYTYNAERIHINANVSGKVGFVGIGTTAPNTRLHVSGVVTATGGTSTTWNFASRVAGAYTTSRIPRWNGTDFVNGSVFDNGTRVGIGTTAPAFKLDVIGGSINTDSVYRIGGNTVLSVKGTGNTFTGIGSGFSNTSGIYNTANGVNALYSNTTGHSNTVSGINALVYNTTGYNNTASGRDALFSNTTGSNNTAIGRDALFANTTGYSNTANGVKALYSNTIGFHNTANGDSALYSNTVGYYNTAHGWGALLYNTTGDKNTANGVWALINNTTGYQNTATGWLALYFSTTGVSNTANGVSALYSNTTGNYNTANGAFALNSNTTGHSNTANGVNALANNTTGNYNTAIGYSAGVNNGFTPSNFTAIGYYAGHVTSNSNEMEIGNTSVSWVGGNQFWGTYSDKRIKDNIQSNVPGLSFITKLNPVTYNLNIHRQNEMCGINDTNEWEGKYDIEKITQTGFLAQEVEQAAIENNYDFNGVKAPHGNAKLYSVQYAAFVVPLVKAVQELNEKLESEVGYLKSEVRSQNSENEKLTMRIEKLELLLSEKTSSTHQLNNSSASLEQNSPNPFNSSTEIKFQLPEKFSSAQLIITDANGKQVRNDVLKSSYTVVIKAAELSAGIYTYSMVIDGVNVDSKQMILTK